MKRFFDDYEKFYSTSQTSPFPERLNGRYEAIIARNRQALAGAKVLDIASHDGRCSFAALKAGASYVKGIEPRAELIENAHQTFAGYGVSREQYSFVCGDVFNVMGDEPFDVVLCLGYFYHTVRHTELLDRIERTGAPLVVLDTEIVADAAASYGVSDDGQRQSMTAVGVQLLREPVDNQQMGCEDRATRKGYTLAGRPTGSAIRFMAKHFGYEISEFDWKKFFSNRVEVPGALDDYRQGTRSTFYLTR
jgi:hypothetical protein